MGTGFKKLPSFNLGQKEVFNFPIILGFKRLPGNLVLQKAICVRGGKKVNLFKGLNSGGPFSPNFPKGSRDSEKGRKFFPTVFTFNGPGKTIGLISL